MENRAKEGPSSNGQAPSIAPRNHRKAQKRGPKNKITYRLIFSGYPASTVREDIVRLASLFGTINIETFSDRECVASCDTATAEKMTENPLALHGKTINISKFVLWAQKARKQDKAPEKKRSFARTKQKCESIIPPTELDLSGDFYSQVDVILNNIRLTKEEVQQVAVLYDQVQACLSLQWPGCTAFPFGSITTGLGIKTSDADCFIEVPQIYQNANSTFVNRAKRTLQMYSEVFTEILSIPNANTPIVKLFHVPTNTSCDLSFKTPLGVQNSRLVAYLMKMDPKILPIGIIIKYWAKIHELSGTGRLSNYALTMMFIFYLQQEPLQLLPSVASLQGPSTKKIIDLWDAGFATLSTPPPTNVSLASLMGNFFKFYADFNFDDFIICPYLGVALPKRAFDNIDALPREFARYRNNVKSGSHLPLQVHKPICIQDPFAHHHNVASAFSAVKARELNAYFRYAADSFEADKPLHNVFLQDILVNKPYLPSRKKCNFKIHLSSKFLDYIKEEDWKSVIKKVTMTMLQDILLLKLTKLNDEEGKNKNKQNKVEKEAYKTVIERAVWRRNKVRVFHASKLGFIEKEQCVTKEILRLDKSQLNIVAKVTFEFTGNRQCSTIMLHLIDGNLEYFRDLGMFLKSNTCSWLWHIIREQEGKPVTDMPYVTTFEKSVLNQPSSSDNSRENTPPGKVNKTSKTSKVDRITETLKGIAVNGSN